MDKFLECFMLIRVGVGNPQLVLVIGSEDLKGQSIVHSGAILSREFAFSIADLVAHAFPTFFKIWKAIVVEEGVDGRFHAVVEEGIGLCIVDN